MSSTVELHLDIILCMIEILSSSKKSMSGETRDLKNGSDEVNTVPESINQTEILDGSTLSSITQAVARSPEPNITQAGPLEMGLPPTPPSRQGNAGMPNIFFFLY